MQLITFISAAAAMATTAHADPVPDVTTSQLMAKFKPSLPYARIINRCDYDVHLWSVLKTIGCDEDNLVTLKKGETYQENLRAPVNGIGVSIKISKTKQCKGNDITQLEYFLEESKPGFNANYLDVSYVDCLGGDCPTMNEGYYLKAGDQSGRASTASAGNTICPVLSCHDPASCSKISYVLPDDVQTRSCPTDQNVEYYMCGGQAPSDGDDGDSSAPASSSKPKESKPAESKPAESKPAESKPVPTPSSVKAVSSAANYKVNAAAVTNAPEIKDAVKTPKVKTNVVYVTKYEYVNAKRSEHAHAHARRHQKFRA